MNSALSTLGYLTDWNVRETAVGAFGVKAHNGLIMPR